MGKTSKLFQLKEWVTLDEAAAFLGELLEQWVAVADILRLALDGKLVLSVHLVNKQPAWRARLVPLSECRWRRLDVVAFRSTFPELPPGQSYKLAELHERYPDLQEKMDKKEIFLLPDAVHYSDHDQWFDVDPDETSIQGVWDLVMVGGSHYDVKKRYQEAIRGPAVTSCDDVGTFVSRGDLFYELLDSEDNNPHVSGSRAQLERLKARIREEQILLDEANYLLEMHREARQQLLDKGPGYSPSPLLPKDAELVVRTEALRVLATSTAGSGSDDERPLGRRSETALLNLIGGLLGLLLGKSPSGKPLSVFKDQSKVVDALLAEHRGKPGMSQRNIDEKLAAAKRSLSG